MKNKDALVKKTPLRNNLKSHYGIYLMLLPGLLCMIIFTFLPYYGITIAFKDFNIFASTNPLKAIAESPWVGLKNFKKIMGSSTFLQVFRNTLVINGLKLLFVFPIPIVASLFICELKNPFFKKFTQTMMFVPYFFSWVIIFGIFKSTLGTYGIVNSILTGIGLEPLSFFTDNNLFRFVIVFTDGWKNVGYNMVIFLAAILAIDPTLYEAAKIDGAGKFRQMWSITIPSILPTIILMLILRVGHILDTGFEQMLVFYNPSVYEVADVIKTYVYRMGIGKMNFSQATALDLFNSVVAFILIVGANWISKKSLHKSIW
jgi:putative aldouronate transport system permease protein